MKKIPMYVESKNGHDTTLVPENKIVEETVKQVQDGKWATLEKQDGTSEIITEDDLDEDEELDDADKELMGSTDWKSALSGKTNTPSKVVSKPTKPSATLVKKFEKVTSVTATSKAKGG